MQDCWTIKHIAQWFLKPINNRPLLFILLLLLLCLPGWIYVGNYEDFPIVRLICWMLFITGLPVLLAWGICALKSKILRIIITSILIILFAVNCFLVLNFMTMVSPSILLLCIETNSTESSEFIANYMVTSESLLTYLLTLTAIITLWIAEKKQITIRFHFPIISCLILLIGLSIGIYQLWMMGNMLTRKTQYDLELWLGEKGNYCIQNTISSLLFASDHLYLNSYENNKAMRTCKQAYKQPAYCHLKNDSLHLIIIIGESFSKHHASLYGYKLNTTPLMEQEKKQGNLFVFSDAVSPYNMTTPAIKNMLSTNNLSKNQSWTDYPPFTIIFKKAGYDVAMWDNQYHQENNNFYDFSLNSFLYNQDMMQLAYHSVNKSTYKYDMDLVDSTLQIQRDAPRQLTLFHLMGQHMDAKQRFPNTKEYNIFSSKDIQRPDLDDNEKQQVADYDNATRYNDLVVGRIINHYRNSRAVIVYLSDHGEEVYDYRHRLGRSHEPVKSPQVLKYQYQIPMMIWCSDSYQQRYPEVVKGIKEMMNKPFSSDCLPQLVFLLGFIETPYSS